MEKILIISLLLSLVYSWESFKRIAHMLVQGVFFGKKTIYPYRLREDKLVSSLILMGAIPIGLTIYLGEGNSALEALPKTGLVLLLISIVAWFSGLIVRYLKVLKIYRGEDKIFPLIFVMGGFVFGGLVGYFGGSGLRRSDLARLSFFMALPPMAGIGLKYFSNLYTPQELLPNTEMLIMILVMALFLQITAELLGRHLRLYNFVKLTPYFRVVLGIILALALIL